MWHQRGSIPWPRGVCVLTLIDWGISSWELQSRSVCVTNFHGGWGGGCIGVLVVGGERVSGGESLQLGRGCRHCHILRIRNLRASGVGGDLAVFFLWPGQRYIVPWRNSWLCFETRYCCSVFVVLFFGSCLCIELKVVAVGFVDSMEEGGPPSDWSCCPFVLPSRHFLVSAVL